MVHTRNSDVPDLEAFESNLHAIIGAREIAENTAWITNLM